MGVEDTNPRKVLADNRELLLADVQKWISDIACKELENPALLTPLLLGLIALRLGQLVKNQATGSNYYRITPFTLRNEGQLIVEKQNDDLVRTVLLFIDKASGGLTPTVRVGTSKGSAGAGNGVSVDAGKAHELGNIRSDVELWASVFVSANTTYTLQCYVIEFA